MAWRAVLLTGRARLRLNQQCCLVERDEGEIRLAFEDLAGVVLDTPEVSLSSALLARFAREKVLLVTCDERHLPNGALLPLQGHFRQLVTLRRQLTLSQKMKKRLWQRLIAGKVANQGRVLARFGHKEASALFAMAERVAPGDPDNIEARAARDYFARLFPNFRRRPREGDLCNAMLNYAYALLRAGLARALVAQGFHPALGIWHDSVDNPFNLADDLIEPWRPLADLHVAHHLGARQPTSDELTTEDRRELARLLVSELRLDGQITTVSWALERFVDSFLLAIEQQRAEALLLPEPV